MTAPETPAEMRARLAPIVEAMTPANDDLRLDRYPHGGGRLAVFEGDRRLIADFYDEANREGFWALRLAAPQLLDALLAADERDRLETLDIVFDGPPGPQSGRFVEVERLDGRSVRAGEWIERPDGYWVMRLRVAPSALAAGEVGP